MKMSRSFGFLGVFVICLSLIDTGIAAQEDAEVDSGSSDPIVNAKQWLENELSSGSKLLTATQRISLLKRYELELRKELRAKPVPVQQQQLLELGRRYWEERAFVEADGLYNEIVELSPRSLGAANALMMQGWIQYGNMMKPQQAIAPFEKAFQILQSGQLAVEDAEQKNVLAAQVASTLGDIYMLEKEEAKAEELYRLLLDDPELVAAADLNARINANAEMARIMTRQERYEEALERFAAARELVKGSDLPAEMKMAFALEQLSVQSRSGASSQEMIRFLEELWDERDEDTDDLNTLKLGNYLVLFYFFSGEEKQREKLADFSDEFLKVAIRVWKTTREQLAAAPRDLRDYYSLVQQTRVLKLEFAATEKDERAQEQALEDFLDCLEEFELPFRAVVPAQFPSQYAVKIMGIYDARIKPELKSRSINDAERPAEDESGGGRPASGADKSNSGGGRD